MGTTPSGEGGTTGHEIGSRSSEGATCTARALGASGAGLRLRGPRCGAAGPSSRGPGRRRCRQPPTVSPAGQTRSPPRRRTSREPSGSAVRRTRGRPHRGRRRPSWEPSSCRGCSPRGGPAASTPTRWSWSWACWDASRASTPSRGCWAAPTCCSRRACCSCSRWWPTRSPTWTRRGTASTRSSARRSAPPWATSSVTSPPAWTPPSVPRPAGSARWPATASRPGCARRSTPPPSPSATSPSAAPRT